MVDRVEGVGDGVVVIERLAFDPQLAEACFAKALAQQSGGLHDLATLGFHRVGRIASWRARAGFIASGGSSHSRVELSRSVNRKVTVPVGSSTNCLLLATRAKSKAGSPVFRGPTSRPSIRTGMASRRAVLRRQRWTFTASDA